MAIEDVLTGLGVELAGGSDREIRAICPVHHLVKGRPDTRPSWYMNRATGAWICFSCHQSGSLPHLVELLGGDQETLREVVRDATVRTIEEIRASRPDPDDDDVAESETPRVYISEYGFGKNPLPPKMVRKLRDIKGPMCAKYNLRWSIDDRVFLIPLYDCLTHSLIGWQEKSKGYFMNVPEGVDKSLCLFGYQQYSRGDLVVVESPLDVVRLAGYGISAVATMGSYVSEAQIDAIARAVPDKYSIVLAFDDDDAGDLARDHTYRVLRAESLGASLKVFQYPPHNRQPNGKHQFGKDPGELEIRHIIIGLESAGRLAVTIRPPMKRKVTTS